MYEKLKREMERQGLNRNQLSIKAQITTSDLYAAMRGDKPFFPSWRKRVADALGVAEAELFDDDETE